MFPFKAVGSKQHDGDLWSLRNGPFPVKRRDGTWEKALLVKENSDNGSNGEFSPGNAGLINDPN